MGFDDLSDLLTNPGFVLLGGGAIAAELLGYIFSKKAGMEAFPLWQLIFLMVGTLVAAAFFANKD